MEKDKKKTGASDKVKVDVVVIQAHEVWTGPDSFERHDVGDKLTIRAADYCANLHKKIGGK